MRLSDSARGLAARCLTHVNEVARDASRGDFESLPGYAGLPDDMKDVEIAATVRHGLRRFLAQDAQDARDEEDTREPSERTLFEERAEQRAEEGMPLDLLLRGYLRGARVLARLLRKTALPGEQEALAELLHALLAAQEDVVGTLTRSYLRARATLADDVRAAQESLVRALLDGTPPTGPHGLGVLAGADGIGVLVLLLPEDGDGNDPVTARRRERRVRLALGRALDAEVPVAFDRARAYALLPGPQDAAGLERRLGAVFGGRCPRAGLAPAATPDEVASAARTADRVLTVALACGRPPGVHQLRDVLLEYHLSRPGESGDRIAALLDPVTGRPELTDTVRTHLRLARNRRATARELGVHPNTVDNRLARFTALTGIDVTTDQGAALALAATLLRAGAGERHRTPGMRG
ncbi:helix-turn-helix domain-containing protein [Streptomyces sp. NPDC006367]|uniref:PucR family transcriptional regulator n=1 Tax=unclassified Streptomyces TaxID=2593676 RepID=UPI0033BB7FD1